ncbi:dnaJ homolog subfamily B member 1 [Drosophila obscura]|uniref:dnaJ homolog subfamily B member 1 n=1 Tax=Drosophila obscura TaxID=7282 RepID=UPI001BB1F12A|nr:dnaJ homolog subfamily B member 1 [Drosophila obscura]
MTFAFARCWAGRRFNREAPWTDQEDEDPTTTEQEEEDEDSTISTGQSQLDRVVGDLSWGNYDHALKRISEALSVSTDRRQIGALLEIKNIVIRLRINTATDKIFGPTYQSDALPHPFTAEMLYVVQKVLRCSNHYEVLRLSQNDTFSEVKRSYKKLALRLHPDKNRAPGAEMAFRRISEAADCLTDQNRRMEYDRNMAMGDSEYSDGENAEQEQEADDATPRRPYRAANQRVPERQALFQTQHLVIGMVCSLLFMVLIVHFLATVPEYSFRRTSTYSVARHTQSRNIAYYLSPKSAAKYTEDQREKLEQQIESAYIEDLKVNCQQETRLRDALFLRMRQGDMENIRQHAENMPTPACDALLKIGQSSYRPLLESRNPKTQKEQSDV